MVLAGSPRNGLDRKTAKIDIDDDGVLGMS
jgi:hypothetical protein